MVMRNYLLPFASTLMSSELPSPDVQDGFGLGPRIMGTPLFLEAGINGEGFKVGVIDSGIDDSHPDLTGKVLSRRDYVKDGLAKLFWNYHGTHVAGIIGANGKMKGVSPGAKFIDYRVLDRNGSGDDANVTQAVYDAYNDGCHVINMSIGSDTPDENLHDAIKYVVSKGIPVVVAAGNDGAGRISYPAGFQEVISVGSVDISVDLTIYRSMFSDTNNEVDVAAHGGWVYSTVHGGMYEGLAGTSMACPHVTGFIVLLLHRGLLRLGNIMSEPSVYDMLKSTTADDDWIPGYDTSYGAGIVTVFPRLPKIRKVSMTVGVPEVIVDGVTISKDVAPYKDMTYNRIFAPVRHQAEPFWVKVSSDLYGNTAHFESWYIPGFEKITSK